MSTDQLRRVREVAERYANSDMTPEQFVVGVFDVLESDPEDDRAVLAAQSGLTTPAPVADDVRDALRYRWLRRFDHFAMVDAMLNTTEYNTLDAAVDAALGREGSQP